MPVNINILVVDDEEVMRKLFTDILQDEGYKVTTVCNGKEAQDIVQSALFDIAFVDIHMPIMDGIKTLRILREITPKTHVVMMDSMPDYLLAEIKKEGAITCIHKPFHITEIKSVVNEIINKGEANG
jgi:CheY-like chemotaxis protein